MTPGADLYSLSLFPLLSRYIEHWLADKPRSRAIPGNFPRNISSPSLPDIKHLAPYAPGESFDELCLAYSLLPRSSSRRDNQPRHSRDSRLRDRVNLNRSRARQLRAKRTTTAAKAYCTEQKRVRTESIYPRRAGGHRNYGTWREIEIYGVATKSYCAAGRDSIFFFPESYGMHRGTWGI